MSGEGRDLRRLLGQEELRCHTGGWRLQRVYGAHPRDRHPSSSTPEPVSLCNPVLSWWVLCPEVMPCDGCGHRELLFPFWEEFPGLWQSGGALHWGFYRFCFPGCPWMLPSPCVKETWCRCQALGGLSTVLAAALGCKKHRGQRKMPCVRRFI